MATPVEKVLKYDRGAVGAYDGVAQTKFWDCGIATLQIIVQSCGINISEDELLNMVNSTIANWGDKVGTNGTNHAGLLVPTANKLLPGSGYREVWLAKEPVPQNDIEAFWKNLTRSIDAGRGVILNFESPPWYRPKAVYKSDVQPKWLGNNTIYHYIAGMGYAIDAQGRRYIWIADPGFAPFGFWISLEQAATLIVPHAYAYAADAPILAEHMNEPQKPSPPVVIPPTVTPPAVVVLSLQTEFDASIYGATEAISEVVRSAQNGSDRAKRALMYIERTNPAALQAFIDSQKGKS